MMVTFARSILSVKCQESPSVVRSLSIETWLKCKKHLEIIRWKVLWKQKDGYFCVSYTTCCFIRHFHDEENAFLLILIASEACASGFQDEQSTFDKWRMQVGLVWGGSWNPGIDGNSEVNKVLFSVQRVRVNLFTGSGCYAGLNIEQARHDPALAEGTT